MFNKLFEFLGRERETVPVFKDFTDVAVDLHSHILPGIDDGVKTLDESIATLTQFQLLGYKKVITTPHVISDSYNNSTETILRGRDLVRESVVQNNLTIQFDAAAEYYFDTAFNEKLEKRDLLTLGKDFVLIEFSLLSRPIGVEDLIYKMQTAGYNMILAHPERYPYYYQKNFHSYEGLKNRGVFFQLNMFSLIGRYGKQAKMAAERMIDNNMIDFLGTDLHGIRHIEMIRKCMSEKYLSKIVSNKTLLNNTLV